MGGKYEYYKVEDIRGGKLSWRLRYVIVPRYYLPILVALRRGCWMCDMPRSLSASSTTDRTSQRTMSSF